MHILKEIFLKINKTAYKKSLFIKKALFYINNKIKEEQGKILNTCTNPIYTDNDEFWSKGVYNNPNDRSVTVEDRAGYGITYNLGTKIMVV